MVRYAWIIFIGLFLFVSCGSKGKKEEIAEVVEVEKPRIIEEFGYVLNNYKVIKDTIQSGESFGEILDRHHIDYPMIYKIAEAAEKGGGRRGATELRKLGEHPEGGELAIMDGRYGPYVTEVLDDDAPKKAKPRRASLFRDMHPETVTLDDAVALLSLPRDVGQRDGEPITAQSREQILGHVLRWASGTRFQVLAPVVRGGLQLAGAGSGRRRPRGPAR